MSSFRELRNLLIVLGALTTAELSATGAMAAPPTARGIDFFEKRIRPVLVKQCYKCHSANSKDLGGKLRLDSREAAIKGGESGPAVAPRNLKASLLINALEYKDFEMPPGEKLPDPVIADFRRWIEMGAPFPRGKGGVSSEQAAGQKLWSLLPLADAPPPKVSDMNWPRGELDRFVLARQEKKGLRPAGDAEPLSLLRRVFFDLSGLPPTQKDIAAFQADHSPAAFAAVVDRLLDSPQFGERWARHWLDVARYAESNGRDRDVLMPHAWRYRDYVIDAYNADVPYDRFIVEQIAGDLLQADTPQERDRLHIATGFLAIGSKSLTGGGLAMDLVDEQIDVTSRAVLGLTASCARCHDHKFDPIPTKDYYALAGVFLSTETLFGGGLRRPKNMIGKTSVLHVLGEGGGEKVKQFREHQKSILDLGKRRQAQLRKIKQLQKKLPKNWRKQLQEYRAAAARLKSNPDETKKKKLPQTDRRIVEYAAVQGELSKIQDRLKQLQSKKQSRLDFSIGVRESKKINDCRIHVRGDRKNLGDVAPRGFLSCLDVRDAPPVDRKQSGRLQLARWLTHPGNPLSARVAVNRIWLHLFGRGIVDTVDNFGVNGARPSHPQLLDFLARRFMAQGWSNKRLIREIVLSHSYQLSSDYHEASYAADPENKLLWRMSRRRLEAEALRDAMLAVSGQLNLKRPVASAVARIGDGEVGRGINLKPLSEPFPHRSVYLPIIRGIVPGMLKAFDFPEPSNPQGRRDATNVPTQSLFLMNNPFVIEQAEAFAKRVLKSSGNERAKVGVSYRLCFGRPPTDDEVVRAMEFLTKCESRADANNTSPASKKVSAWTTYCHALMASTEFRFLN